MPRTASTSGRKNARAAVTPPVKAGSKRVAPASKAKSSKPNGAVRAAVARVAREGRAHVRAASERVVQGGKASPAESASAGSSRGKYVYCIIDSGDPLRFGPVGIGGDPSEVYTVHYKNLAAVVSEAPIEVLDSTRDNVLAHERVNETVMHDHTVIPMSFGTIFKTHDDIIELLRSAFDAFGDV